MAAQRCDRSCRVGEGVAGRDDMCGAEPGGFENTCTTAPHLADAKLRATLYVVDEFALVESVCLAGSGVELPAGFPPASLSRNRDKGFRTLPDVIEGLWNGAADLDEELLRAYGEAFRKWQRPVDEHAIETLIHGFVSKSSLENVDPCWKVLDA